LAVDYRGAAVNIDAPGRRGLTVVRLPKGAASLSQASVAVCHQVTTLDRSKLSRQIGSISREILVDVEQGLKAALDLE
jgi:mRNA-degrading endonuclease toxin of MazEF toxin-antitoxin module